MLVLFFWRDRGAQRTHIVQGRSCAKRWCQNAVQPSAELKPEGERKTYDGVRLLAELDRAARARGPAQCGARRGPAR